MQFIDQTKLLLKAGKGGDGIVAFRREAHVPLGGPFGGDGGNGGSVIFEVDTHKSTLLDLRFLKMIAAQNGENGKTKKMHGADGEDKIVKVPLGTVVKNAANNHIIADLTHPFQQAVIARGGKGGRGNFHFKTARNPAPDYAENGESGEELEAIVELKLLADVGLVGFPSVGKSTILSVVSAARPQIADYPFTTLVPNLGIVKYRDDRSFCIADIPGIIEGAAEGKGLGLRFLRHIERNSILLFMVSCEQLEIAKEYHVLLDELKKYNPELLDKQRILAVTKCDIIDEEMQKQLRRRLPKGIETVFISAVSGQGIDELKDRIFKMLNA
jgi:GTP-binding protein